MAEAAAAMFQRNEQLAAFLRRPLPELVVRAEREAASVANMSFLQVVRTYAYV